MPTLIFIQPTLNKDGDSGKNDDSGISTTFDEGAADVNDTGTFVNNSSTDAKDCSTVFSDSYSDVNETYTFVNYSSTDINICSTVFSDSSVDFNNSSTDACKTSNVLESSASNEGRVLIEDKPSDDPKAAAVNKGVPEAEMRPD